MDYDVRGVRASTGIQTSRYKIYTLTLSLLVVAAGFAVGRFFDSDQKLDTLEQSTEASFESPESDNEAQIASNQLDAYACFDLIAKAHATRDTFKSHYYTIALVDRLAPSQFESLLDQMLDSSGGQWSILKLIVLIKWITIEPREVFSYFKTRSSDRRVMTLVPLAFRYWAQADYKEAYAYANRLPDQVKRRAFGAFRGIGDPRLDALMRGSSGNLEITTMEEALKAELWRTDINQFNSVLNAQFRQDPSAAIDWLAQIPDPLARSRTLKRLASMRWSNPVDGLSNFKTLFESGSISKNDMQDAMRTLASRTRGEETLETFNWMKNNMGQGDFLGVLRNLSFHRAGSEQLKQLVAEFEKLPASRMREQKIRNQIDRLANLDWQGALDWMNTSLPSSEVQTYIPTMMDSAYRDQGAEGVMALWNRLETKELQISSMQQLARSWGRNNLMEFVDWALKIEDRAVMESGLQAVSHHWANTDSEGARLFADALPPGEMKNEFQSAIGNSLSSVDPIKAIEYAIQIEDKNASMNVARNAFSQWARSDPRGAISSAIEIFHDDERVGYLVQSIAGQWSSDDLDGTLEYFQGIESQDIRIKALTSISQNMAHQNPEALIARIDTFERAEDRDAILKSLASNWNFAMRDPDKTQSLVSLIGDPQTREQAEATLSRYRSQMERRNEAGP